MDERQRAAKKKYAGEKQPSMKRRDDNHDYTERRMYMITMEVPEIRMRHKAAVTHRTSYYRPSVRRYRTSGWAFLATTPK